jgi:hypothetical protein
MITGTTFGGGDDGRNDSNKQAIVSVFGPDVVHKCSQWMYVWTKEISRQCRNNWNGNITSNDDGLITLKQLMQL